MESVLSLLTPGRWAIGAACAALLLPAPLQAHAIESSLERLRGLNNTLALQSRYSTGLPAAGASVALVAPDGVVVALGRTDAQGQLRFVVPPTADGRWEVRVDQGPGHRDYLELPAAAAAVPARSQAWSRPHWAGLLSLATGSLLLLGGVARLPRRQG